MVSFTFAVVFAVVCASAFAAPAVGDDLECMACQFIVKEIESQLQANKTESEIIAHLNDACKHFGHLAGVCTSTVDKYAPALIADLSNHMPPATACARVGACKNSTLTNVGSGPMCAICELVVGEVDKLLQQNKTESEIVSHLEDVCKVVRVFKTECDVVVAKYVPEIIQRLVAKEDPQFVCQHVKLCDNQEFAARAYAAFRTASLRADNTTCEICTFVLGYAEKYIAAHPNVTSQEVAAELEKVCKFLPGNDSSKCDTIVTLVEPLIFGELKLGIPPAKVCHDAKMCSTTVTDIVAEVKEVVEEAKEVIHEIKVAAKKHKGFIKKLLGRH